MHKQVKWITSGNPRNNERLMAAQLRRHMHNRAAFSPEFREAMKDLDLPDMITDDNAGEVCDAIADLLSDHTGPGLEFVLCEDSRGHMNYCYREVEADD